MRPYLIVPTCADFCCHVVNRKQKDEGRQLMECISEKNRMVCNCTYEPCPRKYKCCECLHYHRRSGELPACFFSKEVEKTYDRSVENFIRLRSR